MNEKLMNYKEVSELTKGDRVKVFVDGEYKKATVAGSANGADAALWIAFDDRQVLNGNVIATKVYTGMNLVEQYWSTSHKFAHVEVETAGEYV